MNLVSAEYVLDVSSSTLDKANKVLDKANNVVDHTNSIMNLVKVLVILLIVAIVVGFLIFFTLKGWLTHTQCKSYYKPVPTVEMI